MCETPTPTHLEPQRAGVPPTRAGTGDSALTPNPPARVLSIRRSTDKKEDVTAPARQEGAHVSLLVQEDLEDLECRICLQASDTGEGLVHACHCEGTMGRAHLSCLTRWATETRSLTCEICKHEYCEPYLGQIKAEVDRHRGSAAGRSTLDFQVSTLDGQSEPDTTRDILRSVLWHVLILLVFVGLVVYITMFSALATTLESNWTGILWRVLISVILAYCAGRCVVVIVLRLRHAREVRRQQELRRSARVHRVLQQIVNTAHHANRQSRNAAGEGSGRRPRTTVLVARREREGGPVVLSLARLVTDTPSIGTGTDTATTSTQPSPTDGPARTAPTGTPQHPGSQGGAPGDGAHHARPAGGAPAHDSVATQLETGTVTAAGDVCAGPQEPGEAQPGSRCSGAKRRGHSNAPAGGAGQEAETASSAVESSLVEFDSTEECREANPRVADARVQGR